MKKLTLAALCAAVVTGCAYGGGDIADPIGRKFTWFSYLEGTDLRGTCGPGAPDRYRMVYNGNYEEQVRIYELGDGADPRRLLQHVIGDVNLARGFRLLDPTQPWRGRGATVVLGPDERRRLIAAIAESGGFGPPDVGLELPSRSFYWTFAACHQGRYYFNAWRWPSPGFGALRFDDVLFGLDRTGAPVAPPYEVPDRYRDTDFDGDFNLRVGEQGLWGIAAF
jgi:hypothetical protein